MSLFSEDLVRQRSALADNINFLLMSNSKPHLLQLIKQNRDIAIKKILKLAPQKSSFTVVSVKNLGREIVFNTIKPLQPKNAAFHEIPSPTTNIKLMRFFGTINFYSNVFGEYHFNMKPLYEVQRDNINIHWNIELETLIQQIYSSIT